jgi:predicted nucleotidyltransferase
MRIYFQILLVKKIKTDTMKVEKREWHHKDAIGNFNKDHTRGILMKDTGIQPVVLDEICTLAQKYHVKKVILFGSRARGDFKRTSDIDIAVVGGDFERFALDVDEETSTLLEFDFIDMKRNIREELCKSIEREGWTIYEEV